MFDIADELKRNRLARIALALFLVWAILILGHQLLRILQSIISPLQGILVPLLAGFAIAYILDPVADRLEQFVSRTVAVTIICLIGVLVVVLALAVILPVFFHQAASLVDAFPGYLEKARSVTEPWLRSFKAEYPELYRDALSNVNDFLEGVEWSALLKPAARAGGNVLARIGAALAWTLGLLIVPVIAVYLLHDIDHIKADLAELVPPRWRPWVLDRAREVDRVMGRFVRGYSMVSFTLAVIYSVGLGLLSIPMWLFVGITSGILYVIPYLGTALGMVLALILTLANFGLDWVRILGVLVVFGFGQFIESWLLTPRLLGKEVGLHPVVVILAVILGGQLFGVVGMLLALPATAVIRVFASDGLARVRQSALYQEAPDEAQA